MPPRAGESLRARLCDAAATSLRRPVIPPLPPQIVPRAGAIAQMARLHSGPEVDDVAVSGTFTTTRRGRSERNAKPASSARSSGGGAAGGRSRRSPRRPRAGAPTRGGPCCRCDRSYTCQQPSSAREWSLVLRARREPSHRVRRRSRGCARRSLPGEAASRAASRRTSRSCRTPVGAGWTSSDARRASSRRRAAGTSAGSAPTCRRGVAAYLPACRAERTRCLPSARMP